MASINVSTKKLQEALANKGATTSSQKKLNKYYKPGDGIGTGSGTNAQLQQMFAGMNTGVPSAGGVMPGAQGTGAGAAGSQAGGQTGSMPQTQLPQTAQTTYDPKFGVSANTSSKLQQLYAGYQPGDAVIKAQDNYNAVNAQRPGAYSSPYDGIIADLYDQITNRRKFKYDVNGDALWHMYKDQYMLGGQQAMMDTMGQAAQLTGGYGNSYASTAGNQAYQQYMTGLADKVPELEQRAYERWLSEGDDLYNRYAMAADAEQQDYDRYVDEYNMWLDQQNLAYGQMQDAQQQDYNRYMDELAMWQGQADSEMNNYWTQMGYQQDQISAERKNAYDMATTMLGAGMMPDPETLARAGISAQDAQSIYNNAQAQLLAASSGGGGGGSGGRSSKSEDEGKVPTVTQYDKALQLYNEGGEDGVYPYLEAMEANGYNAQALLDYVYKNGTWHVDKTNDLAASLLYGIGTSKESAAQKKKK